jgi:hypothetical protein
VASAIAFLPTLMFMKSFLPTLLSFRGVKVAAAIECNIAQSVSVSSSRVRHQDFDRASRGCA